jgi:hypothetical protein
VAGNVQLSNPYKLALKDDKMFVSDGGRNLVWRVDLTTGTFDRLASFPAIANPMFPALGGPTLDAVPTGIAIDGDDVLVTLLRGAPFPPGTSTVERVSQSAGGGVHAGSPYIAGLKTAIGVLPTRTGGASGVLVLQHASAGPFFGGPGVVYKFGDPPAAPNVVANCLTRPTAMARDAGAARLYVTEIGGNLMTVAPAP